MNFLKPLAFISTKAPIRSLWTCPNCGSPNSVPRDEGCTNCNY